jgi:hypothetical protein
MRTYVPLIAFSLLVCVFPVNSQQPLVGYIRGTVKNQHEAPIAYAAVTATNIDAVEPENYRRTTGADRQGIYQFVELSPGHYSILVKKGGYRDYKIPVVTVRPGETVNMPDIKMSPVARN